MDFEPDQLGSNVDSSISWPCYFGQVAQLPANGDGDCLSYRSAGGIERTLYRKHLERACKCLLLALGFMRSNMVGCEVRTVEPDYLGFQSQRRWFHLSCAAVFSFVNGDNNHCNEDSV